MSVGTAIANWHKFLGYDYYLGSPAPALSPSWGSGTWFRTFMDSIDHDTVDFIPLHCYYDNYGGAAGANTFLREVVDKTYEMYQKPIWVTEFAVSKWGYSDSAARASVKEFLETVIKGLNAREYVERYSWFSFDTTDETNGASALWTNATGELTELGKTYVSCGNPQGYVPSGPVELDYNVETTTRKQLLDDVKTIKNVVCEDYIKKPGVTANASSNINNNSAADKAIDESMTTRWESQHGVDPVSFVIDFGTIRNIKQVNIIWENAGASDYTVEVSENGTDYKTVATIEGKNAIEKRLDIVTLKTMVSAKYVKINCTVRTTGYGYSIYDMAIYGTTDESVNETTKAPEETTKRVVVKPTPPSESETTSKTVKPTTPDDSETTSKTIKPTTPSDIENPSSQNPKPTEKSTADLVRPEKPAQIKLARAKVKSAVKKKKSSKASIKIRKLSKVKGYQIKVSKNRKFKKVKIRTFKKNKFKIKRLKKNRKYYVRARGYAVVNGQMVYGKWSKTKRITLR